MSICAQIVSPDGREIAGLSNGHNWIYRADGAGRPRLIKGALPDDLLVEWSSDGRAIYVRGAEYQPLTLYRLDLATGRREEWKKLAPPDLTGFLGYGPSVRGLGVSLTPDGRFYAYTYLTDLNRLVLIDGSPNWWK